MAIQGYAKPPYSPTRFPAGVTNANAGETLGNLGELDPTKLQTVFGDFNLGITGWAGVTAAPVAGPGGLVTITAAGSVSTPLASFVLVAGRRAFAKTKIAAVGLTASIITGFFNTLLAPTNGVYVTVVSNVLTLTVDDVTSAVPVAYIAGEQFTVGVELLPSGKILAYFNDTAVTSITPVLTTHFGVNFLVGASSAVANATLDYVFAAVER